MTTLADSHYPLRVDLRNWDHLPFFPSNLFDIPDDSLLDRIYLTDSVIADSEIFCELSWEAGDTFEIPLLETLGFTLVFGQNGNPSNVIRFTGDEANLTFSIEGGVGLRIDPGLIKPVVLNNGEYQVLEEELYEVGLTGEISVGTHGFDLAGGDSISLAPFALGETKIVIVPGEVRFCFSPEATQALIDEYQNPQIDTSFRGIFLPSATAYFPEGFPVASIVLTDTLLGNHGFSGTLRAALGDPDLVTRADFAGFPFSLRELALTFVQNSVTESAITGDLTLPFFDEPVGVSLHLGVDGSLTLELEDTGGDGLIQVAANQLGILTLSSLGLEASEDDTWLLLSGSLLLDVLSPELQWPIIELQDLRISPGGEVQLPDGWLDLQEPAALDLFGFRFEITRIGFGNTDDGRRWVGFSGGVHLLDSLPTGASVEGLRVIWDPLGVRPREVTLQGVGFELTLPGVLEFDGDVAFINEDTERYFKGNAKLALLPLGITLDASVKIGRDLDDDFKYIYTFMDLTLPIGLPLWATGAALYGISGLYGMNVNPSAQNGDWYGWYAGPPEQFNVTNADKWLGKADGKALGAGMTLGTLFDLGRVVSTKALFALVLPGPVIILHGMANFLQTPPDVNDPSSQGVFNMLAVLDAQAGSLQLNIDAGWSLAEVIDITAAAEAYFDFANPRNWHVYLGQDQPEDRRIRAYIFSLFHADAFLMISSDGIATGASITWGYDWKFGPVKVILQAWIGAGAAITWQPPQLEGSLNLGGEFEISVAGFGVGLSAEATLSGKTPSLYWIRGELLLRVKLPTPLKDLEEDIVLEWREEATPESEDPFQSISLEHPKVDETWPDLAISEQTVAPGGSGYNAGPLVPLDARPSIVFDRGMKDVTSGANFTSVNAYPGNTQIGDHFFDYELQDVILEKWSKAGGTGWVPVEELFGAWMAVEDGHGEPAFTRLQLWAKSPFAFTRQTARTYQDAFLANHLLWPCAELPEVSTHCVDWEEAEAGTLYGPFFERGGLQFMLVLSDTAEVVAEDIAGCNTQQALHIDGSWKFVWIVFPEPVHTVELCLGGAYVAARAYANGELIDEQLNPGPGLIGFQASGIDTIGLWTLDDGLLASICYQTEAEVGAYTAAFEHNLRVVAGLTRWESQDEILEPETWYRLSVRQETVRTHNGTATRTAFDHYAYFHTAGPPALTPVWGLNGAQTGNPEDNVALPYPEGGKLTDLQPYIAWTIPSDGAQPVYRAYDLGADFNENYVEQMYGTDMAIRLLDGNEQPILDADGQEVLFPNQWAAQPTAELSDTEYPYTTRVENCTQLPGVGYLADQKILFANGVLLEEDFTGDLDQWTDPDPAAGGQWTVQEGLLLYDNTVIPVLGALLVAGESDWTDYAVEVALNDQGESVGLACRYSQDGVESYYRLRLDATGRYFEKVIDGDITLLWQDGVGYIPGARQTLAVQCQGGRLRGQLDAALLFDIQDEEALLSGQVGIYTNSTARFEHFLVRTWPGSALAPQTMYRADLLASFVLFTGGLENGWADSAYDWGELNKDNARIAALGREAWDNYRIEVNMAATGPHMGVIARFQKLADGTFTCYRLLINQDDEVIRLARLAGTYSGSTYELEAAGRTELWACTGFTCEVDFQQTTHDVALTCAGDTLIIEIDGLELGRVSDPGGLSSGKAGLYYVGTADPDFSELVIRSAPRQPVHQWHFVTSRYAGFVEHLDTFTGVVYQETVSEVEVQELSDLVLAAEAGMAAAGQSLTDSQALLASAQPDEVTTRRAETQTAAGAWQAEAAAQFEALNALIFSGRYRPLPPVLEISDIVQDGQRLALLLESPEPVAWERISIQLRVLDMGTGAYNELPDILTVWSDDGARALLFAVGSPDLAAGEYEFQLAFSQDIGLEAPLLRRCGSTLPEIARLGFSLA